jgi:hypothetical protein
VLASLATTVNTHAKARVEGDHAACPGEGRSCRLRERAVAQGVGEVDQEDLIRWVRSACGAEREAGIQRDQRLENLARQFGFLTDLHWKRYLLSRESQVRVLLGSPTLSITCANGEYLRGRIEAFTRLAELINAGPGVAWLGVPNGSNHQDRKFAPASCMSRLCRHEETFPAVAS